MDSTILKDFVAQEIAGKERYSEPVDTTKGRLERVCASKTNGICSTANKKEFVAPRRKLQEQGFMPESEVGIYSVFQISRIDRLISWSCHFRSRRYVGSSFGYLVVWK